MTKILAKFASTETSVRFPSVSLLTAPPISATTALASTTATNTVSYRKNILNLTDDELAALREAFTKLYEMRATDDRSYQSIAGIHGFPPPVYCAHGNPLFSVWHRPYLLMLEKSLQEQVPGVTIPYWDWTSAITQQQGMPRAYTDETDASGAPNPLLKASIAFSGSPVSETSRNPGPLRTFRTLARLVRQAQQVETTYSDYSIALENPHNGLHGWVGGTMGQVPYAAFDPIFWAHHCNVDRLFAEWQTAHPNIIPTNEFYNGRLIWTTPLTPFDVTTEEIWNIQQLGYDYLTAEVQPRVSTASEKFGNAPVVEFSLASIEPNFKKAKIEFYNMLHPRSSCEIRVFLNQPDANVNTPTEDNEHFAGSVFLFGHGECPGEAGHCNPNRGPIDQFDIRRSSHVRPFVTYIDVTESLRQLMGSNTVSVKLVAVNPQGEELTSPVTDFDAIALTTI
ncbi:MAG: tyrosinase family protein [Scytonema sp. PMC 1069.18]|nr:tyrosinase family protein [Scytonema sp. PMC 1069.18]MEC4883712.1 tyrosinase family protein [Scytonema sp. PMC 1070.18]